MAAALDGAARYPAIDVGPEQSATAGVVFRRVEGSILIGPVPGSKRRSSPVWRAVLPTHTLTLRLALLLIFVIPLENSIVIPGFGTVARGIGLLAAGVWAIDRLLTGRMRHLNLFHGAVLLFICWNLLSFFWSVDPGRTYERLQTYVQLFVMVLLIWEVFRSWSAVRAGLQAYVLGCGISAASLFQAVAVGNAAGIHERYSAAGFNQNFIGALLAIGVIFAWSLLHDRGTTESKHVSWLRIVNAAYIPAAVAAILMTGSRTALLALIPGLIYVGATLLRSRSWRWTGVLVAAVAALWLIVPTLPQTPLERVFDTPNALAQGDFTGRLDLWRAGWELFTERPLAGVGTGALGAASSAGPAVAHNVFIGILNEAGLVGLALFCAVIAVVVRSAWKQPNTRSWLWLAVFFTWLVAAGSLTIELKKITWLLFTLVTASAHIIEDQAPRYEGLPAVYD